jgi:DNA-binding protein HU-beta
MTKSEIVSMVVEKCQISRTDVSICFESFIDVIKNSMAEGNNIYIRGFGSFINKKRARKLARDITRNTPVIIEEHYIPKFIPGKVFREMIKTSKKQNLK